MASDPEAPMLPPAMDAAQLHLRHRVAEGVDAERHA